MNKDIASDHEIAGLTLPWDKAAARQAKVEASTFLNKTRKVIDLDDYLRYLDQFTFSQEELLNLTHFDEVFVLAERTIEDRENPE